MKIRKCLKISALLVSSLLLENAFASEKIKDNSFLIEEADNQDEKFVQIIQTYEFYDQSQERTYSLATELPLDGKNHQISFSIAHEKLEGDNMGLGDLSIGYRYQAINKDEILFAPRFSTLLPTGDSKKGLGSGALGAQVMFPFSVELTPLFDCHWNLGLGLTPNAKNSIGETSDLFTADYGTSVVYYMKDDLNLLLEIKGSHEESRSSFGVESSESLFLNPGLRLRTHIRNTEVVPGFSVPIGIGPSKGEIGGLLYLSFEGAYLP